MDIADEELRETIRMIWPLQADKMMDLLVPRNEVLNKNNLTTGKIYAGLLILESWRSSRFGKKRSKLGVSLYESEIHICLSFSTNLWSNLPSMYILDAS